MRIGAGAPCYKRGMDEARFAALIRRHLPFYLALAEGRRAPATPAQRRFVAAARGETTPQTEHEHAFALWRQRTTHVAHTLDADPRPSLSEEDVTRHFEARHQASRRKRGTHG